MGSGALGAEADRTRLIPVAQKLVELGACLETQDAEGRTALHLAAGCGDRAMVLKLIEIGADVNCHDGVGGTFTQAAAMLEQSPVISVRYSSTSKHVNRAKL